jgi:hypothetical protein
LVGAVVEQVSPGGDGVDDHAVAALDFVVVADEPDDPAEDAEGDPGEGGDQAGASWVLCCDSDGRVVLTAR